MKTSLAALAFAPLASLVAACAGSPGAENLGNGSSAETAALGPSGPDAWQWCHDALQATDGTQIRFDYQVQNTSTADKRTLSSNASAAYLNVNSARFNGSENVTIVVIDYTASYKTLEANEPDRTQNGVQSLPMHWDGSNFTAQVSALGLWLYEAGNDDSTVHVYQFALVVNGTWLTDPASGNHNFQYVPAMQASNGCSGFVD